jgi:NADPH:quinone reductase-like Zn-dependent oxidoreductase
MTHVSLNRHDVFTLRGITTLPQPIPFPMILGNDGAGMLDDGTPVAIYPVLGDDMWRGDETLDPDRHVPSELVPGTMADYVAVPRRNAVPLPDGLAPLQASVLGTAWLTAYRALFTKSRLQPGDTLLVQGASGGVSTALIQMGRSAGCRVWVTTRNEQGAELARRLGAHQVFATNEALPHRVDAVIDGVGASTWAHSIQAVRRGGVLVTLGVTSGGVAETDLTRVFVELIDIRGTVLDTLDEMKAMTRFIATAGIEPEIGTVIPMEDAQPAIAAMIAGNTKGKTVFTR